MTTTWNIDPTHSTVGFSIRHMVFSKVRGRFLKYTGAIQLDDELAKSWVEVTIDAASIDTRDEKRDAHLRSPDFFDVERYPTLRFRSAGFQWTGKNAFDLPGELTIHGVTRPVVLRTTYDGLIPDPWGNTRAAFTAETEIDREDFGLTWNVALETGGVMVSKQVKIEIELEVVRGA